MHIENFFHISDNKVSFSRQQGSDFAKQIADDFNPLHNTDAKRFCVPGDLLFAVILARSGLHQKMTFTFSGMVTENLALTFPEEIIDTCTIIDDKNKEYLKVAVAGEQSSDNNLIQSLITAYVEFSGSTFPNILGQLMADNKVMINPNRPMVMYESMSIDLHSLAINNITLELADTQLTHNGKRGNACLAFNLLSEGKVIGHGKKHMLLSGLREYDVDVMQTLTDKYTHFKNEYISNHNQISSK